ncbi:MAG: hypothetical protein NT023_13695 [Armatimonadetes bacterium]|nr:hypothetical protein [Armatimonadota bacterium]
MRLTINDVLTVNGRLSANGGDAGSLQGDVRWRHGVQRLRGE